VTPATGQPAGVSSLMTSASGTRAPGSDPRSRTSTIKTVPGAGRTAARLRDWRSFAGRAVLPQTGLLRTARGSRAVRLRRSTDVALSGPLGSPTRAGSAAVMPRMPIIALARNRVTGAELTRDGAEEAEDQVLWRRCTRTNDSVTGGPSARIVERSRQSFWLDITLRRGWTAQLRRVLPRGRRYPLMAPCSDRARER
jgi:hypothetical protein